MVAFKAFYYCMLPQEKRAAVGSHNRVIMILWPLPVSQNEPNRVQPYTLQSTSKRPLDAQKINNVNYIRNNFSLIIPFLPPT